MTHFVSWCWSYRLTDFVSAVNGWVRKSGVDGEDVFLWICFFCNNQYRILQEAVNARCGCKNVQTRLKVCCEHCTLQLLKTCGCAPLTGPGLRGNCACFILYMFDLACQISFCTCLEASQTGADELKSVFESHLVEAGHMFVLLDTIEWGA